MNEWSERTRLEGVVGLGPHRAVGARQLQVRHHRLHLPTAEAGGVKLVKYWSTRSAATAHLLTEGVEKGREGVVHVCVRKLCACVWVHVHVMCVCVRVSARVCACVCAPARCGGSGGR